MNKFIIIAVVLIIVYFISVYFMTGNVFKNFARREQFDTQDLKKIIYSLDKSGQRDKVQKIRANIEWFRTTEHEDVSITSRDGIKLCAKYYKNNSANGKTAILVHGYKSLPELDFSIGGRAFYELGYDLLLLDQRAHGASGGEYITFGSKERYDVLDWCRWLTDRFGKDHKFILCGISMGCTSAILASCLPDMPDGLECVLADCGYNSIIGEFKHVFGKLPIPKFLLVPIANGMCKSKAGFSLKEFDTTLELQKAKVPYLFVHGENDAFVPCECSIRNYDACPTEKEIITVPGAEHGKSFIMDEDRCMEGLKSFLEKYSLSK
ncbi:MAG: alpha/beta hydrolase [Clostridia bacterium]|nr:alpha/beta hydrolase [Clostridia bacterium]